MTATEFTSIGKAIVYYAVLAAKESPCQSKRGAVIFTSEGAIVGFGCNDKPPGWVCDSSDECKATCRKEAVHAEQEALLEAGSNRAHGCDLLHVKVVDGTAVVSGPPSCVQCSKLMVQAGIRGVWLLHARGWKRYTIGSFHTLSLKHDR